MSKLEYNKLDMYKYFASMSSVLAESCRGRVGVMTRDVDHIPLDGIWHEVERPVIMREESDAAKRVDQVRYHRVVVDELAP